MRRGSGGRGGSRGGSRHYGGVRSYDTSDNRDSGSERTMSPEVKAQFLAFQAELDGRHDKHERLVKLSRDVTIEAKRIIFCLHRITQDRESTLKEAQARLVALRNNQLYMIAEELQGEDAYSFMRAYSPGLQEYLEAASFYTYLESGGLLSLLAAQNDVTFPQDEKHVMRVHMPLVEYLLGIGDLTGELMRLCINCISAGKVDVPRDICAFLAALNDGYVLLGNTVGSRDWTMKVRVLKQNLSKVEQACYLLTLRRTELPEHMLADAVAGAFSGTRADSREDLHNDDFGDY